MSTLILKVGSKGKPVVTLQRFLNLKAKLPKPIAEDGVFTPETKEAVRFFQKKAGLEVDGVVGPETAHALAKLVGSSGVAFAKAFGDAEATESKKEADKPEQTKGASDPAKHRFLRHVYAHLYLVSFLTVGEDEVRAWSIRRGTTASRGAGAIHTDLEKGFIRAEVVRWEDLLACGDWPESKKANKIRLEGRDYVLADGDVILVRFNV